MIKSLNVNIYFMREYIVFSKFFWGGTKIIFEALFVTHKYTNVNHFCLRRKGTFE